MCRERAGALGCIPVLLEPKGGGGACFNPFMGGGSYLTGLGPGGGQRPEYYWAETFLLNELRRQPFFRALGDMRPVTHPVPHPS